MKRKKTLVEKARTKYIISLLPYFDMVHATPGVIGVRGGLAQYIYSGDIVAAGAALAYADYEMAAETGEQSLFQVFDQQVGDVIKSFGPAAKYVEEAMRKAYLDARELYRGRISWAKE